MKSILNIVADRHIWGAQSAFSMLPGLDVRLQLLENKHINRAILQGTDILLTRSSTRVDASLLKDTPVRFAGTATIGDDHYDKEWLDTSGIHWANAAGSSTGSVLEYMITVLLDLQARSLMHLPQTTIGIVGVGRIGSALADLCEHMGMRVLRNDPPRARQQGDHQFYHLSELLQQADIISIHTPLIRQGEDRTVHLLSQQQLSDFKGRGIINAARGSCLDNAALTCWLDKDPKNFAVLDCWEHEPNPLPALIQHPGLIIATPHVAGHSIEGKAANTQYIYNALCQFLSIHPSWDMHDHLPDIPAPVDVQGNNMWSTLHAASRLLYPITNDHTAMCSWANLPANELALAFTAYRRNYPARRAWQQTAIKIRAADSATLQMAHAIGLKIV